MFQQNLAAGKHQCVKAKMLWTQYFRFNEPVSNLHQSNAKNEAELRYELVNAFLWHLNSCQNGLLFLDNPDGAGKKAVWFCLFFIEGII